MTFFLLIDDDYIADLLVDQNSFFRRNAHQHGVSFAFSIAEMSDGQQKNEQK